MGECFCSNETEASAIRRTAGSRTIRKTVMGVIVLAEFSMRSQMPNGNKAATSLDVDSAV
jgi:hypothetical protein